MLTVGTDTYITVNEADEILTGCHNGSLLEQWLALSVEDKECYLRTATYRIDCLPVSGYKHNAKQTLQFPRGMSTEIPYKVKLATAEEALSAIDTELLKRVSLQQQGVKSVSLGSASESYSDDNVSFACSNPLLSKTAYNYMRQFLVGSAVII